MASGSVARWKEDRLTRSCRRPLDRQCQRCFHCACLNPTTRDTPKAREAQEIPGGLVPRSAHRQLREVTPQLKAREARKCTPTSSCHAAQKSRLCAGGTTTESLTPQGPCIENPL